MLSNRAKRIGGVFGVGMVVAIGFIATSGQYVPGGGGGSIFSSITVGALTGTVQTDTTTGTVNDFVINAGTTTLRWSSASGQVTYNGFKCGVADCQASDNGRRLRVIVATGLTGNTVTLASDAAASVAGNRIYAGTTKWVLTSSSSSASEGADLEYDGTALRWRVVSVATQRIDPTMEFVAAINADSGIVTNGVAMSGTGNLLLTNTSGAGHIRTTSTGGFVPALTSCGGSPALVGTDIAGVVTEGTTATGCIITFSTTYGTAPACIVTSQTQLAAFSYVVSATAITITNTSNSGDVVHYHCIGDS